MKGGVDGALRAYTLDVSDPEHGAQISLATKEGLTFEPRCAEWGHIPWPEGGGDNRMGKDSNKVSLIHEDFPDG